MGFKVTQKDHSLEIIYDLQRFFNCEHIHIDNRKENAYKFNVNKLQDILNIIIPHFDRFCLLTSVNLDYLDFKKLALMLKDGLDLKQNNKGAIVSQKKQYE